MMMRVCRHCNQEKEITQFTKVTGCLGGYNWQCRACIRARNLAKVPPEVLAKRPRIKAAALFAQGLKMCSRCEETKPLSEFYQCQKRFTGMGGYQSHCKKCQSGLFKQYRKDAKDALSAYHKEYLARPGVSERKSNRKKRAHQESPRMVMQITLAHGLKRRPTDNPATIDDLMGMFAAQDGRCAITQIPMTWAKGAVLPTSISLDRIDPDGGYSSDNLRLVCHAVNAFRGRMSDDELFVMALAIVTNMKKPKLRLVS